MIPTGGANYISSFSVLLPESLPWSFDSNTCFSLGQSLRLHHTVSSEAPGLSSSFLCGRSSCGLVTRNGLVIQDWSCYLGLCLWFMCGPAVQVWDCALSQSVWSMPLTHCYPGSINNGIWQSHVNQRRDKVRLHCWRTGILSLLGALSKRPRIHSVLYNCLLERNPLSRSTGLESKDLSASGDSTEYLFQVYVKLSQPPERFYFTSP